MAKTSNATSAKTSAQAATKTARPVRQDASRDVVTIDTARRLAPTDDVATKICKVYAKDMVEQDAIAQVTHDSLLAQSAAMPLTDKNREMHFQRIVGQYVGSAVSAARFYDAKRQTVRDMASKFNADRDEDRDGPSGFDTKLERAQDFAAEMAWQALATLASAEGALTAYEHLTGSAWKPYVGNTPAAETVSAQSAAMRASAFD